MNSRKLGSIAIKEKKRKQWDQFRYQKLAWMGEKCSKVLDFGQSARQDRLLFDNTLYITADIDSTTKPDIVADICDLNMIEDEVYDGIVCIAILEHVYDPIKATNEVLRILQKGGMLFGYVPFLYPYHAKEGHYKDFYRYTRDGVEYLLRGFQNVEICPVRGNASTVINLLPGNLNRLQGFGYLLDRYLSNRQVSGFYYYAEK